ncbi:tetratricopeptide repeat protein [Mucilaginibacter sp. Mucisp84]|uniref:tetratricopeptide repeat protein n=1 Tax=Mucilaginibacter sp. Mucisp84 TaxID=3243058 RepID=UPI0039A5F17A
MTIIHSLESLLYDLFPEAEGNDDKLVEAAKRYYTVGAFEPKVTIVGGNLIVEINTHLIEQQKDRYDKVVALCERGQFKQAKKDVTQLIAEAPQVSEYHRILGQILSEEGDQEAAINALIDALRWNPKNEYGLLMMGNIFAKYKDDIDTALKYYDEVLKVNPDDHIALNNIGANLMQHGKAKEAANYFKRAIAINSDYPNTQYALALSADMLGDYQTAFDRAIIAIEKNRNKDALYGNSFGLAIEAAQKLTKTIDGKGIVDRYASELYGKYGKAIKIEADSSIPTAAKIEFAENHARDYHLVKYKPEYPAVEHLMLHELVHLELAEDARAAGVNMLYTAKEQHKAAFFRSLEREAQRLKKQGVPEKSISTFFTALFDGINRQNFNAPADLFIEDLIYSRYPSFRPFQFLSLLALAQESIEAVTKPEIVKNMEQGILSVSKIFNIINALHLKSLYKVDLTGDYKPTKAELDQAKTFYEEFGEYRNDKAPGEEYELVQHWGEDLKLDRYFALVSESEYRNPRSPESVLEQIERDPLGLTNIDPEEEQKMRQFIESHSTADINMAVCIYMVGAIEYFSGQPLDKVKETAFEIAMLGRGGIDPKGKNYTVASLKGKLFSGYQMIAYFYVSWALGIPDMVAQLGLPFQQEYALAQQLTAK